MKQLSEQEFYDKIMKYFDSTFENVSKRIRSTDKIIYTNSGDNGVLMQGPFSGYSLRSLIEFAAKFNNKQIKSDPRDDNF